MQELQQKINPLKDQERRDPMPETKNYETESETKITPKSRIQSEIMNLDEK